MKIDILIGRPTPNACYSSPNSTRRRSQRPSAERVRVCMFNVIAKKDYDDDDLIFFSATRLVCYLRHIIV